MTRDQLSFMADVLGIISGVLAILGVGGLLSWSVFHRGTALSEKVLVVFAYALKTFLCIALLGFMLIQASQFWDQAVYFLGGDDSWYKLVPTEEEHIFNQVRKSMFEMYFSVENVISTIITLAGLIPIYIILVACIYRWSLEPLRALWNALRK